MGRRWLKTEALVRIVDAWARSTLGRGFAPVFDAVETRCGRLYLIREEASRFVKVGHCYSLINRACGLRNERKDGAGWPPLPRTLSLVCLTGGGFGIEQQLLRLLLPLRRPSTRPLVPSEWLGDSAGTVSLVEAICSELGAGPEPLPFCAGKRAAQARRRERERLHVEASK